MSEWKTLDDTYVATTYKRFPVEIVRGEGSLVYDADGRRYIDMGSGIGVTAFGHADPEWVAAVTAQLTKVSHTSNLYYTEPCARLAALLCERTGLRRVFFGNSGAEANECAIKVARKYAAEKRGLEDAVIVTLKNSFHGRTLTTLAATGQDHFHKLFRPLTPGFVHAGANDLEEMTSILDSYPVAAVLLECVQGEGGVIALCGDYLRALEKLLRERDVLLMIDEGFLAAVKRKSERIRAALEDAKGIRSVSGLGLMIGIETVRPAAEVVADCMASGVLCLTAKHKVRLLPPLNIDDALLDEALALIIEACAKGV